MMWFALVGAILSEVAATMSLRASDGLRKKAWLIPLIICYPLALILLTVSLSAGMSIGVAYGIWAASGVALTAVLSKFLFDEPFTWIMAAGIALVVGGVLLVELGAAH